MQPAPSDAQMLDAILAEIHALGTRAFSGAPRRGAVEADEAIAARAAPGPAAAAGRGGAVATAGKRGAAEVLAPASPSSAPTRAAGGAGAPMRDALATLGSIVFKAPPRETEGQRGKSFYCLRCDKTSEVREGVLVRRMAPVRLQGKGSWALAEHLFLCPRCCSPYRVGGVVSPDGFGRGMLVDRGVELHIHADGGYSKTLDNILEWYHGGDVERPFIPRRVMGLTPPSGDARLHGAAEVGILFQIDVARLLTFFGSDGFHLSGRRTMMDPVIQRGGL